MLGAISWTAFGEFILVGMALYYLWFIRRFYGTELGEWFGRDNDGAGLLNNAGGAGGNKRGSGVGGEVEDEADDDDHRDNTNDPQFKLMEGKVEIIGQIIEQGRDNEMDRENVLDHVRQVISETRELKGTKYERIINSYIRRVWSGEMGTTLEEDEVADLWK
jgi:hypothetical protein